MLGRHVYRVHPTEEGWIVAKEGEDQPRGEFPGREKAIAEAVRLAESDEPAKVVIDNGDNDETEMMGGDGGIEDQKLAEKSRSERNAGQRRHRHEHGEGQERRTLRQPGETFQLISGRLTNESQDGKAQ